MALLSDNLIAHYKMNENTAGDNAELVTNGNFAAWTADNPDSWTVSESPPNQEISEVGTGEGHGGVGTGMCNIYTVDTTNVYIYQDLTLIIGKKYRVKFTIDTFTSGQISVYDPVSGNWSTQSFLTSGEKEFTFVASATAARFTIGRKAGNACDATIDDVSFKLLAIEDSSGNDHDAIAQQDSDAISVAGKINTALEFNGSSDYVIIPDHADFSPALTPFSISAWANMDDTDGFIVASKYLAGSREWNFQTHPTTGTPYVLFYDNSAVAFIGRRYNTDLVSYANQWIHLVATYDGGILSSGVKIYLNGLRVDDQTFESGTFVSVENLGADVYIGREATTYSNGTIDNVMFFSKELTALEVQLLYNSGAGVETIPIGIHLSRTGQQFSSSPMN